MYLPGQHFRQRLNKRVKIQLTIFIVVAIVSVAVMVFGYIKLPTYFGIGQYTVTVQLPRAAGLYPSGNVTYRGTEVGRVADVHLTDSGVNAVLSLRSDLHIPADVNAEVHSVSGVGEQYVALLPRSSGGPALKNGDVVPISRTSVPPDINALLDATNRGLQAIPRDNVKTVVDESYLAFAGLGPDISRLVRSSTQLAIDARANLDPLTTLIDRSGPILDSQANSSESIHAWANHVAELTRQLKTNDAAVSGVLEKGPAAADEGRQLLDRLQPTIPVLMANLSSLGRVAVVYQPAIEQILVLAPLAVAGIQSGTVANRGTKHGGQYLDFNLNLNLPPPCTTGYLPAQQRRTPDFTDVPERTPDDMYCRIPQDAPNAVRGARNFPCLAQPGKRAPTAAMCESDEQYVPLNDGNNWKGDANATITGQDVPQPHKLAPTPPPAQPLPPAKTPPVAVTYYDPSTGSYVGPDGQVYTQSDLAQGAKVESWQSMLTPGR